jgi:hypothetical protein
MTWAMTLAPSNTSCARNLGCLCFAQGSRMRALDVPGPLTVRWLPSAAVLVDR